MDKWIQIQIYTSRFRFKYIHQVSSRTHTCSKKYMTRCVFWAQVATLCYRAPECVFPPGKFTHYSFPSDLWSVVCNAFFAMAGYQLFELSYKASSYDLAKAMVARLGPIPGELVTTNHWSAPSVGNSSSSSKPSPFAELRNIRLKEWLEACFMYQPALRPTLKSFKRISLQNNSR